MRMLVYGVFDSREAAELAVKQIMRVMPHAKVKRFSPIRDAGRQDVDARWDGTAGMNFAHNAMLMPYPVSFGNAWGAQDAAERPSMREGGQTALRVQVADKPAAGRAAALMRQAGGAGIRQTQ